MQKEMERCSYILCGIYPGKVFYWSSVSWVLFPQNPFTSQGAEPVLLYTCLAFLICDTVEDVEVGEDGGGVGLVGHN